jgi:hypothetical protein
MNLRRCAHVRIGRDVIPSSELSSSSEEFVEVRLGMKCVSVECLFRSSVCCFLGDGVVVWGWFLWLRLCSSVARSMYPTSLGKE